MNGSSSCPFCMENISANAVKCPHCHEWLSDQSQAKEVPDTFQLYQIKAIHEIRQSVENDLRKKYAWLAIIVALFTGGGITLIVNGLMSKALQNVAVAEALQARSIKTLDEIDKSLKEVFTFEKKIEAISEKSQQIEAMHANLSDSTSALTENLLKASQESLKFSDAIRREVNHLADVVRSITSKKDIKINNVQPILGKIDSIQQSLADSQEDIRATQIRLGLGNYPILVRDFDEPTHIADKIISKLKSKGYRSSHYNRGLFDEQVENNLVIGIGVDVPASVAAPVVAIAIEHAPFLAYVNQIVKPFDPSSMIIGGKTKRAVGEGARRLTRDELLKLTNPSLSNKAYHALIASFLEEKAGE